MVLAVIPSRYGSSRFPGKPLANIGGLPLVARVAKSILDSGVAGHVIVATDHPRIARAVGDLPVRVLLDSSPFRTGTDRVAAAAAGSSADVVLNVQGDEPLVSRVLLEAALGALAENDLGTVAAPLEHPGQLEDPDMVKVQVAPGGRAIRFSRRPLPGKSLLHLGIYAYRRDALDRLAALPRDPAELAEDLEQLRALGAGMNIGVGAADRAIPSVNRPADIPRVERWLAAQATLNSKSASRLAPQEE